MKEWYAVQSKPRQESVAVENLERQGFSCFLPRVRLWKRRRGKRYLTSEALFPRYLFVHVDLEAESTAPIRSTRGVSGLVKFGLHPVAVPEIIIDSIMSRADEDGVCSEIDNQFSAGQRVQIEEGPFDGLEAIFVERNGEQRAIVLLQLLGGERRIELPMAALV